MKMIQPILNRITISDESVRSVANRSRVGIFAGWISIVGNSVLFIIKFIFSWFSGSIALMADAFHTLSDVISSIAVILGFKLSQKPPDKDHPFGHGRVETISTLTIAILICIVGIEFLKFGIMRIITPQPIESNWLIISAVCITILIKEGMSRFSFSLGDLIDSDTLRGDAIHHRSDVYSSLLVIVALIGGCSGYFMLDGIMAIIVAVFMLYSGYAIAKNAINDFLGKPATAETISEIKKLGMLIEGVYNIHDIIVHSYGAHRFISLHVEVREDISSSEMHIISDNVEKEISKGMNAEVVTHIDPVTLGGENIQKVREALDKITINYSVNCSIQDVRIVGTSKVESILFQVAIPVHFKQTDLVESEVRKSLSNIFPEAIVIMEFKYRLTSE